MDRFCLLLVLAVASCGGAHHPAALEMAPGTDEAARVNYEGVKAMEKKDYFVAQKYFQSALALRKDGRFWFNLCAALYAQEKYGDANFACNAVEPRTHSEALIQKANELARRIRDEAHEQQRSLDPSGLLGEP